MIGKIKNIVRNNKKLSNLSWAVRGLFGVTKQSIHENYFRKKTAHIIPQYFITAGVKKLQIGGGPNVLEGWLNTNIYCGDIGKEIKQAFMDATKRFPFPDESFQYIFAEHMIEHISYSHVDFMIGECSRVLKKGGRIRLATPGWDNLVNMIKDNPPEKVRAYFEKLVFPKYGKDIPIDPSYALNYSSFSYGHTHIHSKVSLTHLLTKYGFGQIEFFKSMKSNDPNLRNIEINHIHVGTENNVMETLVIEGVKQ
jgi:predicted SAM-dependent methyltransferase